VFAVVVVIVAVLQVAMGRLRWGRRLYAVGSNPEAAAQAGLPTRHLVFGAFCACGALSGFAGFLFLARFGNITVVAGQGLELDSVGAAVVGGVSVLGGSGTLVGAFLGALLINLLDQSLVRVPEVSEFWRNAILGALILLAVIADTAIGRRFRRRWSAEARPPARVEVAGGEALPDAGGAGRRPSFAEKEPTDA
jgi:rhamnose transport system permease protein